MARKAVKNEATTEYTVTTGTPSEDATIRAALAILEARVKRETILASSNGTKNYLIMRAAGLQSEVFSVMFLDNMHGLIAVEDMFTGTIDGAAVYPREVVKAALHHNAAAVILTHNHPSGVVEPSQADIVITRRLKQALGTIDVRVLDHIVTAGGKCESLAERGLV